MGTDSLTTEQIAASQATELAQLRATVARLTERLGPDPDAAPPKADGFPKIVYRKQADPDPDQLDHPGWDALKVLDQSAFDAALKAGWQEKVGPYVYTERDEEVVVVKQRGRSKK